MRKLLLSLFIIAFQSSASNDDVINDYLTGLNREKPSVALVLLDVVGAKKNYCGMELNIRDIRLISKKDTVLHSMARNIESDPAFHDSVEYRKTIRDYFGKC